MLKRLMPLLAAIALVLVPLAGHAQAKKDTMVIAMTLEPPGLDPTAGAASAIAEIVLYNVFETLTKVGPDGIARPLLAESWEVSPDLKTVTFKLRKDVKFQNGEPFNAQTVKFAFERAAGEKSTNKDKRLFQSMAFVGTPDPYTVVIGMKTIEPDLLFLLGQGTAIIVEPKSADTNATQPVGTGPFKLDSWQKGSSLTLVRWPGYRNAASIKLAKVTFRFISDPAAQVASLLSGDVDVFQRVGAARSLDQFKSDGRFQIITAGSRAKTILAINNKKKPLDDVRVRRAIAAAIDRKAVIEGAADGLGAPIGSHYVPGALGYVDTTGINPFNVEKAKTLLKEAGVTTPLELSLKLPPVPYARQGGEVIAAELAKIGIVAKIENVEWAQWLDGVYGKKNYDLTIITHAEPFDLGNFAKDYYWGYSSPAFNKLFDQINNAPTTAERAKLLGEAQKMIANDAVAAYLYAPQYLTVANKKVKGLPKDMPIWTNDLSVMSWE